MCLVSGEVMVGAARRNRKKDNFPKIGKKEDATASIGEGWLWLECNI